MLGTQLALGSYWGFLALAAMTPFLFLAAPRRGGEIVWEGFAGDSAEYRQRVLSGTVPMVW